MSTHDASVMEQPHRLFAYPPTTPRVPADELHSLQRWFFSSHSNPDGLPFSVYRHAGKANAQLWLEHWADAVRLTAVVPLSVAQLRALAVHLLRAADDIEAHQAVDGAAS